VPCDTSATLRNRGTTPAREPIAIRTPPGEGTRFPRTKPIASVAASTVYFRLASKTVQEKGDEHYFPSAIRVRDAGKRECIVALRIALNSGILTL
jgi:hypothetical protein